MAEISLEPVPFAIGDEAPELKGETLGAGPPIVLVHGITATRRYVVHGSLTLAREGFLEVTYDARGHGESDPAPAGSGYQYPDLVDDLERVIADRVGEGRVVLAGHSMGAHTVVGYAIRHPDRVGGLIVIGPVQIGLPTTESALRRWNRLADGLERDGVDGFMEAFDRDLNPDWRERILHFTRARMKLHRHPEAVAQAMREIAIAQPFESLDELEFLDFPSLVVASHDDADPLHPYAVAEAYAARLPRGRLISEEPGEAPLAWKGGPLAREIASFSTEPEVAARLSS